MIFLFLLFWINELWAKTLYHNFNSTTLHQANTNLTVECIGDKPLIWTYFLSSKNIKEDDLRKRVYYKVYDNRTSGVYRSELYFKSLSYFHVNYYYCHYRNAPYNDENDSVNFYLYINDTVRSAVGSSIIFLDIDKNYPKKMYTIPCRPTNPSVNVSLLYNSKIRVEINITKLPYGEVISYDDKIGYTLNYTSETVGRYSYLQLKCCYKTSYSLKEACNEANIIYLRFIKSPASVRSYISNTNLAHATVGDNITLKCFINLKRAYYKWLLPYYDHDENYTYDSIMFMDSDQDCGSLHIRNLTLAHAGFYKCMVYSIDFDKYETTINFNIFEETYSNLTMVNSSSSIRNIISGKEANLWISFFSHPQAKIIWTDSTNKTIPKNDSRRSITLHNSATFQISKLVIKDAQFVDSGLYEVSVQVKDEIKNKSFYLNVTGDPVIQIATDDYYLVNETVSANCTIISDTSDVDLFQWKVKKVNSSSEEIVFELRKPPFIEKNYFYQYFSTLNLQFDFHALLVCEVIKANKSFSAEKNIRISDFKSGFGLRFDTPSEVYVHESKIYTIPGVSMTIYCGASKHNFTDLNWDSPVGNRSVILENKFSFGKNLTFTTSTNFSAKCEAKNSVGETNSEEMEILVFERIETNLTFEKTHNRNILEGNELELVCNLESMPRVEVEWYKDDEIIKENNRTTIVISEESIFLVKYILKISSLTLKDSGKYQCKANNKIEMEDICVVPHQSFIFYYVFSGIFVLVVTFFGALLIVQTKKYHRKKELLKQVGLSKFEIGEPECINTEQYINDQTELLHYDEKWEFPLKNIKLEKILGSGEFGLVFKGTAKNIIPGEDATTVAVKMVKTKADITNIKALVSELKIMIHLGSHLNVVNLLGACTRDIDNIMIIVEYCRFGNLKCFLNTNENNFVNQIDDNGAINFYHGPSELQSSFSASSMESPNTKYLPHNFAQNQNHFFFSNERNIRKSSVHTYENISNKQRRSTSKSEDCNQLGWWANYKGDYKKIKRPICTKDLICWSFQLAKGMEYLASKQVLHGDLAARNVLLADNNVVKICDFGLARNTYQNINYKKTNDCLLPMKWMAIESLTELTFSTKSDVWSFGIVLWELFSLAKQPYPELNSYMEIVQKLKEEKYRLEKPKFATRKLYDVMLSCWEEDPCMRPPFTNLAEILGKLLEEGVDKYYIELNQQYVDMNLGNNGNEQCEARKKISTWSSSVSNDPGMSSSSTYVPMRSLSPVSEGDDDVFFSETEVDNKNEESIAMLPQNEKMEETVIEHKEENNSSESSDFFVANISNPNYFSLNHSIRM